MRGKLFIIMCLLVLSPRVHAQQAFIHNGFVTGEQYLRLQEGARLSYVKGLVDGIWLAPLFGGSERRISQLRTCVEPMSDLQLDAILSKYLNENPGYWHRSVHISMYTALLAVCPGLMKG
jgi:hypothetical protein